MENKNVIIMWLIIFSVLFFYLKDKQLTSETKVGKMHVSGTSNSAVMLDLKDVMKNTSYRAINLTKNTSDYLCKEHSFKSNYKTNKKFIIYDSAFDSSINCPYGRKFQTALNSVKSNENIRRYFDFYHLPPLKPYMSKNDMEKYKQMTGNYPADVVTKEEADIALNFHKTCSLFCVVNPKTNHVITFSGVGVDEAEVLPDMLKYLKNNEW